MEKNLDVFSKNENDLGCANHFKHKIDLNNKNPIYVKQFRIAEAYRAGLFEQVKTWLALGVIKPSQSKYNNPIFVVPKKTGKPRYVLDYRQLNKASVEDKYSMRTVDECIADIGYAGSSIFSIMDLSNAFHQMLLDDDSSEFTSFTVPPIGQFKFTRTSQGLASAPSNFQRMMELAMIGLNCVIVYFDDLLIHTKTHAEHILQLQHVFNRLRKCNLKLNPLKCHLGTPNVDYLGFRLTPQGILPGVDKLKCVRDAPPPSNVTQIKQFLGLANFFRTHVRNFSLISNPLTKLTRKDSTWKGGELPEEAQKAFFELKTALISEPCLAFPRSDRKFTLIVDSAIGSATCSGGLGAILCQTDEKNELHPISYASRSLAKHERNYSAFLIELTGCVFGIEHFSQYLKGRRFDLLTDHKPLVEKLSTVHSKTLNRLQHIMMDYDFEIKYLKGEIIPADYLSRNVLESIDIFSEDLLSLQKQDQFCNAVTKFLHNGTVPLNGSKANYIRQISPSCFVENDILWRRMKKIGMPTRTVLVVPRSLSMQLVKEAHGSLFAGHNGVEKCRERLLQSYFWPNMEKDIKIHLNSCTKCQARKKKGSAYNYLQPMPQCTAPNQRLHVDLFGPLLSTDGKKFILTATDAFSKYCNAWPINNKSAETVAKTLFDNHFCKFGTCLELVTDQGLEFNNKLCDELCKLLQIKHNTTTAYRPQTNSTSEVFNKTIAKYLSSFVDKDTKNWIEYINPMLFAYNTSYHSTTKCTPYFLTYGHEARYPSNPQPDIQYHYGNTLPSKWYAQLQETRQMATHHSVQASENSRENFDSHTFPIKYTKRQLVWLNEHNFLGKNRKLSANWSGPYPIIKLFDSVVELKLPRRFLRVNVSRIKPYISPVLVEKILTELPAVNVFIEPKQAANEPNFENDPNVAPPPNQNVAPPLIQNNAPPLVQNLQRNILPNAQQLQILNNPAVFRNLGHQLDLPVPPPPPHTLGNTEVQDEFIPDNEYAPPPPPTQFHIIPFAKTHPVLEREYAKRKNLISTIRSVKRNFFSSYEQREQIAINSCVARSKFSPVLKQKILNDCKNVAALILNEQRKKNSPPPSYKHSGDSEDIYVRDTLGLPVFENKATEPSWVTKRREFLKKLSVQDRNLLLTGDPYFQFDPIIYDCIFFLPFNRAPPILQQQLGYLNPDELVVNLPGNNFEFENDDVLNSEPESDAYDSNGFVTADSSSESCTEMPHPPPSTPEPESPLATRSGRQYNVLPQLSTVPSSTSSTLSSFLSRAGRAAARLLDGHPLLSPGASSSPRGRCTPAKTPKSKAKQRTKR